MCVKRLPVSWRSDESTGIRDAGINGGVRGTISRRRHTWRQFKFQLIIESGINSFVFICFYYDLCMCLICAFVLLIIVYINVSFLVFIIKFWLYIIIDIIIIFSDLL